MKSRKTDNLTVRFEPRLRYLASLGARSQHRSLSAFVEWAVQEQLKTLEIHGKSLLDLSLWDVDEALVAGYAMRQGAHHHTESSRFGPAIVPAGGAFTSIFACASKGEGWDFLMYLKPITPLRLDEG